MVRAVIPSCRVALPHTGRWRRVRTGAGTKLGPVDHGPVPAGAGFVEGVARVVQQRFMAVEPQTYKSNLPQSFPNRKRAVLRNHSTLAFGRAMQEKFKKSRESSTSDLSNAV